MAKVRYTAARTGVQSVSIYPYGLVKVGDVIEVKDDVAERYLTEHPTREYGTVDDVEARWTREELDVIARDHRIDPSEYRTKGSLAAAIYEVDKTAAGKVMRADFEKVTDSEEADVAPFGDKAAEPPEPIVAPEPAADDADEGVTNDG